MTEFCAVVPVYNHERAVAGMIASLRKHGLPVILVDDGSGPSCAAVLDAPGRERRCVGLHRLAQNQGKGAAVLAGLELAAAAGYTHVLQIDADGQHDASSVPRFLAAAAADPDAVVCGQPVFDASIPRHRLYLRYLTHAMVWLNTLSFDIPDAMCGLRVYPLASRCRCWPRNRRDVAWTSTSRRSCACIGAACGCAGCRSESAIPWTACRTSGWCGTTG